MTSIRISTFLWQDDDWRSLKKFIVATLWFVATSVCAATQLQINTARDKAAAWLLLNQHGDGSWTNGRGNDIGLSAQAMRGLALAGVKSFAILNAEIWLTNAEAPSVDSLSRLLLSKSDAQINLTKNANTLLSWVNTDFVGQYYLWGSYPQYSTNIADTSLAWRALLEGKYVIPNRDNAANATLCLLLANQRSDGSWGMLLQPTTNPTFVPVSEGSGSVLATTQTILMLNSARTNITALNSNNCAGASKSVANAIDTALNSAATWLTTVVKNADGGIGENGLSNLAASIQALQTLRALKPGDATTAALLDYILSKQNVTNGSWANDAYLTGNALEILAELATPATDTDGDGIPDSIEVAMGTDPQKFDVAVKPTQTPSVVGINAPFVANQAFLNKPYNQTLSITGGTAPYAWSVATGLPPPGILLSSTGVLTGTPTSLGVYPFEVSIQDSSGASTRSLIQITVVRSQGDGDINGDGKVDIRDVILVQRMAQGLIIPTQTQLERADVAPVGSPDGLIDLADVLRILRKALGIESD